MLRKLLVKMVGGDVGYYDAETGERLANISCVTTGVASDDIVNEVTVHYLLDEVKFEVNQSAMFDPSPKPKEEA